MRRKLKQARAGAIDGRRIAKLLAECKRRVEAASPGSHQSKTTFVDSSIAKDEVRSALERLAALGNGRGDADAGVVGGTRIRTDPDGNHTSKLHGCNSSKRRNHFDALQQTQLDDMGIFRASVIVMEDGGCVLLRNRMEAQARRRRLYRDLHALDGVEIVPDECADVELQGQMPTTAGNGGINTTLAATVLNSHIRRGLKVGTRTRRARVAKSYRTRDSPQDLHVDLQESVHDLQTCSGIRARACSNVIHDDRGTNALNQSRKAPIRRVEHRAASVSSSSDFDSDVDDVDEVKIMYAQHFMSDADDVADEEFETTLQLMKEEASDATKTFRIAKARASISAAARKDHRVGSATSTVHQQSNKTPTAPQKQTSFGASPCEDPWAVHVVNSRRLFAHHVAVAACLKTTTGFNVDSLQARNIETLYLTAEEVEDVAGKGCPPFLLPERLFSRVHAWPSPRVRSRAGAVPSGGEHVKSGQPANQTASRNPVQTLAASARNPAADAVRKKRQRKPLAKLLSQRKLLWYATPATQHVHPVAKPINHIALCNSSSAHAGNGMLNDSKQNRPWLPPPNDTSWEATRKISGVCQRQLAALARSEFKTNIFCCVRVRLAKGWRNFSKVRRRRSSSPLYKLLTPH